jgi:hypothetical protein
VGLLSYRATKVVLSVGKYIRFLVPGILNLDFQLFTGIVWKASFPVPEKLQDPYVAVPYQEEGRGRKKPTVL